jgi:hypothetical protein
VNAPKYDYKSDNNNLVYIFFSVGKKIITKIVVYEPIDTDTYNLAFGDYDLVNQTIDDKSISNNGDTIKVLATVIQTIHDFFEVYPLVGLQIQGSTSIRTKLYQKIIRDNLTEIETEFKVFALKEGEVMLETPTFTQDYERFYIYKK